MKFAAINHVEFVHVIARELQPALPLKAWASRASIKLVEGGCAGCVAVLPPALLHLVKLPSVLLRRQDWPSNAHHRLTRLRIRLTRQLRVRQNQFADDSL